jgi:hypothetical protein
MKIKIEQPHSIVNIFGQLLSKLKIEWKEIKNWTCNLTNKEE